MKEKELREIAECALCHKGIGHTGLPLFWRVRLQRYALKMGAMRRQSSLETFFDGHVALAQVMGADEDMAERITEVEITVCETCAIHEDHIIAFLAEAGEREEDEHS